MKELVMRGLSLLLVLGVSLGVAEAQPADPAGSAAAAADSAAPAAGSTTSAEVVAKLRKTCTDAMNENSAFARSIIQKAIDTDRVAVGQVCADVDTIKTHQDAVTHVERNERHVLAAYAAMWAIAALFLLYLLRRQQRLKAEIAQLRRDLDTAVKDEKDGK